MILNALAARGASALRRGLYRVFVAQGLQNVCCTKLPLLDSQVAAFQKGIPRQALAFRVVAESEILDPRFTRSFKVPSRISIEVSRWKLIFPQP